jgi:hypothetical protein
MDIQQKLNEAKKELAESEKHVKHFTSLNEKLSLEYVE